MGKLLKKICYCLRHVCFTASSDVNKHVHFAAVKLSNLFHSCFGKPVHLMTACLTIGINNHDHDLLSNRSAMMWESCLLRELSKHHWQLSKSKVTVVNNVMQPVISAVKSWSLQELCLWPFWHCILNNPYYWSLLGIAD